MDGNYNIQVISRALSDKELTCTPMFQKENDMSDLSGEEGFICHSNGDHWLAIRKVHGVWYNLNSTNKIPPGAQIIGDFMLEAIMA